MYNHAPENYTCPFCLVVQGIENERVLTLQADVVYRAPPVTAFVSVHQWPNNPPNLVIVPDKHFENIYDLPEEYALPIHRAARELALALKKVYACAGVSLRQHNEPAGNQDVWHYHLHLTPRFPADDFYSTKPEWMPPSIRAAHAARIREYLEKKN
jgi:histidine triad (HIT) family protein